MKNDPNSPNLPNQEANKLIFRDLILFFSLNTKLKSWERLGKTPENGKCWESWEGWGGKTTPWRNLKTLKKMKMLQNDTDRICTSCVNTKNGRASYLSKNKKVALVDDATVCGYEKNELPVRCPYCGRTKLRFWKPIL